MRKIGWSRGAGVIIWGEGKGFDMLLGLMSIDACKFKVQWDRGEEEGEVAVEALKRAVQAEMEQKGYV